MEVTKFHLYADYKDMGRLSKLEKKRTRHISERKFLLLLTLELGPNMLLQM